MKWFVSAVVAVVGICAVQVATAATASAHAELVSSTPADGGMFDAVPPQVELVFSENVGKPAALVVSGPDGHAVAAGDVQVVDATLSVDLQPEVSPAGWYTISYQVTSSDGHPISGTLSFMVHGVGEEPSDMPAPAPPVDRADPTEANAAVVAMLAVVLAAALTAVFVITRRWLLRTAPRSS